MDARESLHLDHLETQVKRLKIEKRELLRALKRQNLLGDVFRHLKRISTHKIVPKTDSGGSEATAIVLASDWHVEETVKKNQVNGLNEYNLDLAKARAETFFRNSLRLIEIFSKDVQINTVVLALLGDFITNDIHDELPENCALRPTEAILYAQDLIASGIEFWLANSKFDIVVPCHSGNHGRTTEKTHFSNENGHSLEFLMYHALQAHFAPTKRVKFLIADGYHSFVEVYGKTVRFHHGHAVKYQGGVGGIYIPVNKAIAQWNKARWADYDCFGHFHQCRDGGNFVSNGSLIGWNAYGIAIKAEFEEPKQALFLIDKVRGRTISAPILFKEVA